MDPTHGCDRFQTYHLEDCPYRLRSGDCRGGDCVGDYVENTLDPDAYYAGLEWAVSAAYAGRIKTIILDDQSIMKDRMICAVVEDPDAKVPIDDWGPIKRPLNRILTKIAAAPVHLLITSRASMVTVEASNSGKITAVHKAATPKVWDDFLYPCDFVFYLYSKGSELAADKLKYFAQIQKSRVRDVPELRQGGIVENPSFEGLFATLLKREAGLPTPIYDDPDKITRSGPAASTLASEQEIVLALAALKNATNMETLASVWTNITVKIQEGGYTLPQQKTLLSAKNASKARLNP